MREHLYLWSHYYYDDSEDAGETDNVQWISGHRTHEFVQSEVWAVVKQTLTQITGAQFAISLIVKFMSPTLSLGPVVSFQFVSVMSSVRDFCKSSELINLPSS